MKVERHSKIVELIGKYEIGTQEELAQMLNEAGFNVTQATVSRDIRELKLTKVQAENGRQRYVVLEAPRGTSAIKYIRILKDGFVSMGPSQTFCDLPGICQTAVSRSQLLLLTLLKLCRLNLLDLEAQEIRLANSRLTVHGKFFQLCREGAVSVIFLFRLCF